MRRCQITETGLRPVKFFRRDRFLRNLHIHNIKSIRSKNLLRPDIPRLFKSNLSVFTKQYRKKLQKITDSRSDHNLRKFALHPTRPVKIFCHLTAKLPVSLRISGRQKIFPVHHISGDRTKYRIREMTAVHFVGIKIIFPANRCFFFFRSRTVFFLSTILPDISDFINIIPFLGDSIDISFRDKLLICSVHRISAHKKRGRQFSCRR